MQNPQMIKYEQLRLARIRQQRQRMENMKKVIEKYSIIITQLDEKNKQIIKYNQNIYQQLIKANQQIQHFKHIREQYNKQCQFRKQLQDTVKRLKEDISILTIGMLPQHININYKSSINHEQMQGKINYQMEYETMQELYEDMKKQFYDTIKQNAQLKNMLKQHDKSYRKIYQSSTNQSKSGRIRTLASEKNLDFSNKKKQDHQINNEWNDIKNSMINKIKLQQNQIRGQKRLIEKFKMNEQKSLQLIQQLKGSKSKMCICHLIGKPKHQTHSELKSNINKTQA